jgi:FeS assembly SUF system protein
MSRAEVKLEQIGQRASALQTPIPEDATLREKVVATLCNIYDPEIPVNLYDLGLIYAIDIDGHDVSIVMTLTTPHCPVAGSMPGQVENAIKKIDEVDNASVTLTWNPPWSAENLSDEVKLTLGLL